MYKYPFFNKQVVVDQEEGKPFLALQGVNATCATSARGLIHVGTGDGTIYTVGRSLDVRTAQPFKVQTDLVVALKSAPIVVAVGSDEEGIHPVIKVFNTQTSLNTPTRTIALPVAMPVSCVTADESLSYLAVGLVDGTILLFKGDISRDRLMNRSARELHKCKHPITALQFRPPTSGGGVHLFAATPYEVWSLGIEPREFADRLSDNGVQLGCACCTPDGTFWTATENELQNFLPDTQGGSFPVKGIKASLISHGSYIVVVTAPDTSLGTRQQSVVVCSPRNRLIVFDSVFEDVRYVLSEWGSIYILTASGKMFCLSEIDFESKISKLFDGYRFDVAIDVTKSSLTGQARDDRLTQIYSRYAAHLYSKKMYDEAMDKYILTIGHLEPSFVIQRFLDPQRIHNLTTYLQALHDRGMADKEHTTLLLNCYTKLKDEKRLDRFLRSGRELAFDLETALSVCRQAGYSKNALYLAKQHKLHDWYLKVQLEDIKDYHDALTYIAQLNFEAAVESLKQHGKALATALPDETLELLIKLCTGYKPTSAPSSGKAQTSIKAAPAAKKPSTVSHLASLGTRLLNPMGGEHGTSGSQHHAASPVPPSGEADAEGSETLSDTKSASLAPSAGEDLPRSEPELYIHIFVNQPSYLKRFLTTMVEVRSDCSAKVYETLLEVFLQDKPTTKAGQEDRENWIMRLLESTDRYDPYQAMVLAQVYDFKPAIIHLYKKHKQYQQIIQYHMEKDAYAEILDACHTYGSTDRNLWAEALAYFAGKGDETRHYLKQTLDRITTYNLLPPLLVLDVLAGKTEAKLSVVKDYIVSRIKDDSRSIAADEDEIRKFQDETQQLRQEIHQLKTEAKIFQDNRCAHCLQELELPSVHFLCGHSYHFDHLPNPDACPICSDKRQKVADILDNQRMNALNHDQFVKRLDGAEHRFSVVAEQFGQNLFLKTPQDDTSGVQGLDDSLPPVRKLDL